MEFLTRLRGKNGAAAGAATALDQFFSPGAARARRRRTGSTSSSCRPPHRGTGCWTRGSWSSTPRPPASA